MPRSSSSSQKTTTSPSRFQPALPLPAPKVWQPSPPPTVWKPSPPPSIWQSAKEGIGFGAGAEVGRRVVGGVLGSPRVQESSPHWASKEYSNCLEYNKTTPEVCRPFLSKDKSPWTQCMEMNFFKADLCAPENTSTK